VRGHLGCRVVAPILALEKNTGKIQLNDFRGLLGRQLSLQIDELALRLRKFSFQFRAIYAKQADQLRADAREACQDSYDAVFKCRPVTYVGRTMQDDATRHGIGDDFGVPDFA